MSEDEKAWVTRHWSESAALYATSSIHSRGLSRQRIVELANPTATDLVVDVATGAGHTAVAIAPLVRRVIAVDLSVRMLEVTCSLAAKQRLNNIEPVKCDAEALAFRSNCVDLVTCRIAPHHFNRPDVFVRECARILKPGGRMALVDTWVPDDVELDHAINQMQALRDSTHRRSLSTSEWKQFLNAAGLEIKHLETWFHEGEASFNEWVAISRTAKEEVARLKSFTASLPQRIKEALKFRTTSDDLYFQLPRIVFLATKKVQSHD
jgi:ubiquinone/menaquinone biosynthesis C-methylase UbiE